MLVARVDSARRGAEAVKPSKRAAMSSRAWDVTSLLIASVNRDLSTETNDDETMGTATS